MLFVRFKPKGKGTHLQNIDLSPETQGEDYCLDHDYALYFSIDL